MTTQGKRQYVSVRRQQQAAKTRRRLAESARRLFQERGYAATTIAEIAAGADLAVQTFYAVYGSKRAVLSGLIDQMEENAELPKLLDDLRTNQDARHQLASIVDFNLRLFGRGADILETLRSAAPAEPELAAFHREGDARRRQAQAGLVHAWATSGQLRGGLPETEAAEVLWALTSPDVYRLFVFQNGWEPQRYGQWLTQLLTHLLFHAPV